MTADSRFDRDLSAVLEDLYLGPTPNYRREVLAVATHRRQRPSWTFPRRWLPIADTETPASVPPMLRWRTIGLALLIVVLLAAGLAIAAGSQRSRIPAPFGPARNGLIVYPSNGDVLALDPSTGDSIALVTDVAADLDALYSPDGTRIAFSRLSGHREPVTLTIVVADAEGSHPTPVTIEPLNADGLRWEWAPDSRSLFVQTGRFDTGPLRLMRVDAVTPSEPQVVATGAELIADSARPPDGRQLLLRREGARFAQLTLLDLATRREQVVARGDKDDIGLAAWSNDGARIAYVAPGREPTGSAIWIVNADLSSPQQVVDEPGTWAVGDPAWSPDDTMIAFTRWRRTSPDGADNETWDIAPIGVLDVASRVVKGVGPVSRDVRREHPYTFDSDASPLERLAFDWSPDGTTLLAVPTEASGYPVLIDPVNGTYTVLDTVFNEQGGAAQLWQRRAP